MLENYKIRVNNEAESKEAQELFFELGAAWSGDYKRYLNTGWSIFYILVRRNNEMTYADISEVELNSCGLGCKELTLPQLNDLVVLKRNDVKDANYESVTDFYYVTVENKYYFWNGFSWCLSDADFISGLTPVINKTKPQDPALISGAEALRALADGKEVEFKHDNQGWVTCLGLNIEQVVGGLFQFRLKPQTIKLELELPKPFEPKLGDEYFCINDSKVVGWTRYVCDEVVNPQDFNFGVWRNEEEIKKVVEQLRKIRGV